MENTIFRKTGTENYTLEFFVVGTNELDPYREIRELGIVILNGEQQIDFDLSVSDIDELIDYLEKAKSYCRSYNKESKPLEEKSKS